MVDHVQVIEISKLKEANKLALALGHNRRTDGRDPEHIDPSKTHLNITLYGQGSFAEIKKQSDELMATVTKKPRKDYVRWLEVVISLPAGTGIDETAYFKESLKWFKKDFEIIVLSADIHNDEKNPHMHILALPLFQGRMIGASFTRMDRYWPMHKSFNAQVGCKYGLILPQPKTTRSASVRATAADSVIAAMKADSKHHEPAFWDAMRLILKPDPEPLMKFYGIEYPATKAKKEKTFNDVMIKNCPEGKAKGKAIAFTPEKCIAFDSDGAEKEQRLSRGVFARNQSAILPEITTQSEAPDDDYTRIHDADQTAGYWNELGDFVPTPPPRTRTPAPAIERTRAQLASLQKGRVAA